MSRQRRLRSMTMVIVSMAAWLLFVLAGASVIVSSSSCRHMIQYVVVKSLNGNHRLVEGDVAEVGPFFTSDTVHWSRFLIPDLHTRSDFRGRYLSSPIANQQRIELFRTLSGPRLFSRAGGIAWIPLRDLPASEIAALDVQDNIEVCNLSNDSSCGTFTVDAIACPDAATSNCTAAVDLTAAQLKRVWNTSGSATGTMPQVHVFTVGGSGSELVHHHRRHR
jgi:hypothetical protein